VLFHPGIPVYPGSCSFTGNARARGYRTRHKDLNILRASVNQCLIMVMFQFINWSVFTFLIWQAHMSGLKWRHQIGFLNNDRNHAVLTGYPDQFFFT
jgi:hypothetical protein